MTVGSAKEMSLENKMPIKNITVVKSLAGETENFGVKETKNFKSALKHITRNKMFLMSRMMPHERAGMMPFVWLSEGTFTVIALFKGDDWFLYGACKEYEYNDMPEPMMLTQEQFDTVAEDNPSKNLTYELYRMMYKADKEYKN